MFFCFFCSFVVPPHPPGTPPLSLTHATNYGQRPRMSQTILPRSRLTEAGQTLGKVNTTKQQNSLF